MKTSTNRFETTRAFFAMLAIIALLAAPFAPVFASTTPKDDGPKVTICHLDDEEGVLQPITISTSAVTHSGYIGHAGDIIPPFGSGEDAFAGQNWDTAGQATWNNGTCVPPTPTPTTLKVHIYKYLKTDAGTAQVPNDAGIQTFPMTATWSATNIGSGSGSYVLGNTHGGAAFLYAADTSAMSAPANYATNEVTDGTVLAPADECVAGKYRLVGYKTGDSLSAASNAALTTSAPSFTGLTADKYIEVVNELCPTVVVPQSCEIVSDTSTLLGTTSNPAVLTYVHPAWTHDLSTTSAQWLWTTALVSNPGSDEVATFTKVFNVTGAPTGATLRVAADNSYTAYLNGTPLSCDGSGSSNFTSPIDSCSAPVVSGYNTLTFVVKNDAYGTTDPHVNPAGLEFDLIANGA